MREQTEAFSLPKPKWSMTLVILQYSKRQVIVHGKHFGCALWAGK